MGCFRLFACITASLMFLTSCQPVKSASESVLPLTPTYSPAEISEISFDPLGQTGLTRVEQIVRAAAVKVSDPLREGHGSGTYVKIHGRYAVITAAHVVDSNRYMWIVARDEEVVLGRVVYTDPRADLAIIVAPKLETRKAIKFRPRRQADLVGERVVHTGFPGKHDLLTIRGSIAGARDTYLIMHSYGWFGSSGSGVYDSQGRLVGVVSALDVGMFWTPQALENIIWVASIWQLDLDVVKVRVLTEPEIPKQFPGAATPRRGGSRD